MVFLTGQEAPGSLAGRKNSKVQVVRARKDHVADKDALTSLLHHRHAERAL
jgi:hypothetical protein